MLVTQALVQHAQADIADPLLQVVVVTGHFLRHRSSGRCVVMRSRVAAASSSQSASLYGILRYTPPRWAVSMYLRTVRRS